MNNPMKSGLFLLLTGILLISFPFISDGQDSIIIDNNNIVDSSLQRASLDSSSNASNPSFTSQKGLRNSRRRLPRINWHLFRSKNDSTVEMGIKRLEEGQDSLIRAIRINTQKITKNTHFGIKQYIGFIATLLTLFFGIITFWSQRKTEKHTKNAPLSAQIGQFKDLTRHLYRNLVCTSAAIGKYYDNNNQASDDSKKKIKKAFPSEGFYNKLKTIPDDVILDIDVKDRTYSSMQLFRLLLRNYNAEIEAASKHIAEPGVADSTLTLDFGTLLFKPLFLVKESFHPESLLLSTVSGEIALPDRCMLIMIAEHLIRLKDKANYPFLGKTQSQDYLKSFFGSDSDNPDFKPSEIAERVKNHYQNTIDQIIPKSVDRSLGSLFELGFDFGSSFIKKDNEDYVCTIKKSDFTDYLRREYDTYCSGISKALILPKIELCFYRVLHICRTRREVLNTFIKVSETRLDRYKESNIWCFFKDLSGVSNLEGFKKTFPNYKDKENEQGFVSYESLYKSMIPYIQFLSQDTWDFNELLYVMLAVDLSIEVNRIGMVNYPTIDSTKKTRSSKKAIGSDNRKKASIKSATNKDNS